MNKKFTLTNVLICLLVLALPCNGQEMIGTWSGVATATSLWGGVELTLSRFQLAEAQDQQTSETKQRKAGEIVIREAEAPVPGTERKVPVDFGTLYVPENRQAASSRLIEIAFLRYRSASRNPGPPIIYLEGGPGVSGINSALGNMYPLFSALQEIGDVIVLDQRGSGRSSRLVCPGTMLESLGINLERDEYWRQIEKDSRRCAQALREQKFDLAAYNTNENADDVNALREALGAPQANLLAFSYGTHLASAVIKRHPGKFQRAVLIGTAGPDHLHKLPSGLQAQLVDIDRLVRADARLSGKIPSLLGLIATVHRRLEKQPVTVEVTEPQTRQKTRVTIGKFGLQFLVAAFISRRDFIAAIPTLYDSLSKEIFQS